MAAALQKDYPEIQKTARFYPRSKMFLSYEDKKLYKKNLVFADSSTFDIFDYEFLQGNPRKALNNPNSIVLTQALAEKLFERSSEAMGKTIKINDHYDCLVTGLIKNIPDNTSLQFSGLISTSTLGYDHPDLNQWGNLNGYTYLLLKAGTDAKALNKKMQVIFDKYIAKEFKGLDLKGYFTIQALNEVHLDTSLNNDWGDKASMDYIYIYSRVSGFIQSSKKSIKFVLCN